MKLILAFLFGFLSTAVIAPLAADDAERFPRASPESQGIDSERLLRVVTALDAMEHVHSFMLMRHGKVVAEGWWKPYAAEHNHVLFSVSKSFAATAVGMAAEEGKLSLHDPVISFFPDDLPAEPSWQLKAMRIRDLLTMSTGHEKEPSLLPDEITAKSFLAAEVPHAPGGHFRYNTAATFMLSAIVEKQTGQGLVDYLKPRLFEPLGIDHPVWETNAEGIALGGYGLRVRTEDIAALGQLYLREGEWDGRRLLTREWTSAATSKQVSNGSNPDSDWNQGYGYQFWQCRHDAYRMDGAFGQFCIVFPKLDAVVAITSGLNDMGAVMNILWDKLLPAFHYVPIEDDPGAASKLSARLSSLEIPTVAGKTTSPLASKIAGKTFRFEENADELETLQLAIGDESDPLVVRLQIGEVEQVLPCGFGEWRMGSGTEGEEPAAGSYAWTADNVLTITSCAYETPFITTFELHFEAEQQVRLERKRNVGWRGKAHLTLSGSTD